MPNRPILTPDARRRLDRIWMRNQREMDDRSLVQAQTVVDASGGVGEPGDGHTIQEEGSSLTQRAILNFIGDLITAADNPGLTRTDVTVTNPVPAHEAASNPHPGYATDADLTAAVAALTADIAELLAMIEAIDAGGLTTRWEPVTNGDPLYPEIVFDASGDVVMAEVAI